MPPLSSSGIDTKEVKEVMRSLGSSRPFDGERDLERARHEGEPFLKSRRTMGLEGQRGTDLARLVPIVEEGVGAAERCL